MNDDFELKEKYYSFIKEYNIHFLSFEIFKNIYDIGYRSHIEENMENFKDFNNY